MKARHVPVPKVRHHETTLSNPVVSSILDDQGNELVLSRLYDNVWDLHPYFDQSNVPESMKSIKWPTGLPEDLINDSKSAMYRWMKHGRPGYVQASARTVFIATVNSGPLLFWLADQGVTAFDEVRPLHLANYLHRCRGEKLRPRGIKARFEILDLIWLFRTDLRRPLPAYPWGDHELAKYCGVYDSAERVNAGIGKTPVIPRDVQSKLFVYCESWLSQANELLEKRDAGLLGMSSEPMRQLRDCCLYLLSITSGMRNEEAVGVEINATRSERRDGVDYHWVASVEHKTGKGRVEYLVPAVTLDVVRVLERYALPLQGTLQNEIEMLEASLASPAPGLNTRDTLKRLAQARKDSRRLILGVIYGKFNQIVALSCTASGLAFLRLARDAGVSWKLSPHQCRRTYARTFVESRMGRQSLVFLKWQFKHSSISMSQLYAANPAQDPALYEDILEAQFQFKRELLEAWNDSGTVLSGGAGRKIMSMRASTVTNRESLIKNTASQINIRATGHGWCIAQDAGCGGAGLYENTRCVDCKNSVIDVDFLPIWQGIHEQQRELLELDDLGPVANARIERDIALSAKVLSELGLPFPASSPV